MYMRVSKFEVGRLVPKTTPENIYLLFVINYSFFVLNFSRKYCLFKFLTETVSYAKL